ELYIAGQSIGAGYINDPQQTEQSFIAHPFDAILSDRLYKTGDLVRSLPDSNLQFIGRTDHQIKIRGFRVELGEIEAELSQHPALKDVACSCPILQSPQSAHEDTPGNNRLVAYLVAHPNIRRPSSEDLHIYLKERLPGYMLPAIFIYLDALPLSPN